MSKWLALVFMAVLSVSVNAQEQFTAGKDYVLIDTPVRTVDPNKIEVTEVFWYGCGHCNNFRPIFDNWKKTLSDDVVVQHSPAMWNKNMRTHAQIYYTAKTLGKQDVMHKAIFDAMHTERKRLTKSSEIYSVFAKHDVNKDAFEKTFKSFGVKSMVQQADARARSYGITGTPEVIINGKYRTSASHAGSYDRLLKVAEFLIDKERNSKS